MRKSSNQYTNHLKVFDDLDSWSYVKTCEKEGCKEPGEFRAPKIRGRREYYWFCLEHVREYNEKWDYYKGMNEAEIDSHRRSDMTWHRPSWPLGQGSSKRFIAANRKIHDPFSIFEEELAHQAPPPVSPFHPDSDEAKALILMDLEMPLDHPTLKERYKVLAKKYHPDHNPKDPSAEERLKAINHAYAVLKVIIRS